MVSNRRRQEGFTLIELLIVVAILALLAGVAIPNVGRFLGTGGAAARDTELHNVQSAVTAMMVDNDLNLIMPVIEPTGDMRAFPDNTTKNTAGNNNMYALWDSDPDDDGTADTRYVTFATSTYCYRVTADGTVTQIPHKWNAATSSCE